MVFEKREIDQFVAEGYVVLRAGFSREVAERCCHFVWREARAWDQCTSYSQPMIQIQKIFHCPPFDEIMNPRLATALDEIVGAGRWHEPPGYGWWSLLLPGLESSGGWHVDGGDLKTRGHLTDHHHALVTLFLFSDAGPGDGGTVMVRGSHQIVAQANAETGDAGISWSDLKAKLPASILNPEESRIAHLAGEAGDVALMHPFLVHGFGANIGKRIRFGCNPLVQLREQPNLNRADGAYSPVEVALRRAIGLES